MKYLQKACLIIIGIFFAIPIIAILIANVHKSKQEIRKRRDRWRRFVRNADAETLDFVRDIEKAVRKHG